MKTNKHLARVRRHERLRKKIKGSEECPRLAVFRSNRYIYAQIIDDNTGMTLVSANSSEKDLSAKFKSIINKDVAAEVGKLIGDRAIAKGIKQIVFDRGGYKYHGRVKSLADGAREAGLVF